MHTSRIQIDAAEIGRMSPADFFAMKNRIIREARRAQAAAIHAAFAQAIASVGAFARRHRAGTAALHDARPL